MNVHEITCQHLLSGIGRYGWELADGMAQKGVLNTFHKPWKKGHSDEVYHTKDWVRGYRYRSLRNLHPYLLPYFIRRSLRVNKGDLLHAHWFLSGLAISSYKKNPRIITMHDVSLLHLPEHKGQRYIDYYARSIQTFRKREIPIIVVSEQARQDALEYAGYPDSLVHVVYNGVNHEQFYPLENDQKRPAERFRFVYSGGLGERKNVGLLLTAFKEVEKISPECELILSGAHPERTEYPAMAKELGIDNITFTGFIPDEEMADFYRSGHCMVFPSRYEGFGLAPLESMACGTPVLSARGGALTETSGDGALFFNYDTDDLKDKMLTMINDQQVREEYIRKGMARAAQFTWKHTVNETLRIYRTLS
ncbi:MAG: glycosyltransferase family 1 protein [Bacteroidota bacterium]